MRRSDSQLNDIIAAELAWQASLQLANGSLPMYAAQRPGEKRRVCPYFACFGALSLLIRPDMYAVHARRYMDWHFAHLNTAAGDPNGLDGTICDYTIVEQQGGILRESAVTSPLGRKAYDSTDSYAALFLMLLAAYYEKTGDGAYLLIHRDEILRVYRAMLATLDHGLSFAKPDWPIKYTMDNCEVFQGLAASGALFAVLEGLTGDALYTALAKESRERKSALAGAMERLLWNRGDGFYHVGLDKRSKGFPRTLRWKTYYPDAMAQLFPIFMGVLPPGHPRAAAIWVHFNRAFPDWAQMPGHGAEAVRGIAIQTAARMGDRERLSSYLIQYKEQILDAGHPGCLNAECAHVAMAAERLRAKA